MGMGYRDGAHPRTRLLALVAAFAALAVALAPAPTTRASGGSEVTLTGTLRAVVDDDFVNHRSTIRYHLETDQGLVALEVPGGGAPAVTGGGRVTVTGTRLADGRVRVEGMTGDADGALQPMAINEAPTSSVAWPGPAIRRVAVVLATYTDIPEARTTPDLALEAVMGAGPSVRSLIEAASRGRTTVDATVIGPWSLGISSCDGFDVFMDTKEAVEAKAASLGLNLSVYDHVIMWTRPPCGGEWIAQGEMPGQFIHMSAEYPDTGTGREHEFAVTAAHEMGHTMGLGHANSFACTTADVPVPLGDACSQVEYGDPYSVMGGDMGYVDTSVYPYEYRFLSPLFSAPELDHLGWLDPGEAATVTTGGTYGLASVYGPDPGVRLLRIRRVPDILDGQPGADPSMRSGWWTLELRAEPPEGPWDAFGPGIEASHAVILRYVEDGFDYGGQGWGNVLADTLLVDMDPETVGDSPYDSEILDSPLEVGETFSDPLSGTQISLASLDPDGATVDVAFPGGPPPAAPSMSPAVITSVEPGDGRATVAWTAPATAGTYPPDGYTVRSYPGLRYCFTYPDEPQSCTVTGLANGTPYRFVVTYGTGDHHWTSSAPSDPVVPSTPPTSSMSPLATYRTTRTITAAWTGAFNGGPVDSFDVRYRSAPWNGSFGSHTTWLGGTTATSGTITGGTGRTYCISSRARVAAVTGPWSAEACTAVPLDDRSLKRSSGWTAVTGSAYYQATALRTSSRGRSLTRTGVVAKRIALVATTCSTCGSVKVYWNGTYTKIISLRSSTTRHKVLLGALSFASARSGTLKLVVSTSSKRVTVDGIAISRL